MTPLVLKYRKLRRQLQEFGQYLHLDRHGNKVVRRTDFTRCERPVLMIYGFMSTRRTFAVLEHRLRRDGYCVWSINLGGLLDAFNTHGIHRSAELVHRKVERMYARFTLGPLTIIGHSKGGLIGTDYVKRLGGSLRVKNLITLGTPLNGTPVAYLGCAAFGLVSKSIWQLIPNSRFLRKLKKIPYPPGLRVVSIYSRGDQVSRYPSCVLDENDPVNPLNVELPDVTHREFLIKRSVYEVIRRELALSYGDPVSRPMLRSRDVATATPLASSSGSLA